MASKQITMWLQGLFLFAVVWSLGGTITGDSRKKFDLFYRSLVQGENEENPRPASIKLQGKSLFPDKGRNRWMRRKKVGEQGGSWGEVQKCEKEEKEDKKTSEI